MNTNKPFGRSLALIAAMQEAVQLFGSNKMGLQQAIAKLSSRKEFQSRGHGRNKRSGVNVKALSKMKKHFNSNHYALQSYVPFGGAKEIARRAAAWPQ